MRSHAFIATLRRRNRTRPRLLDAFCCEGGASKGYEHAGFDVFGVDLFRYRDDKGRLVGHNQSRYPFPSYQGDAVQFILDHGHEFDAIHASPPCQHASIATSASEDRDKYPRLIEPTRAALEAVGRPYVIENVKGAALLDPTWLCGCQFGLTAVDDDGILLHLERRRGFESNVPLHAPRPCDHSEHEWVGGSYGGARRDKYEAKYERKGGYVPPKHVQQALLGIDWMTEAGMYQSLPPAYTAWVGKFLMDAVRSAP
jgi:DNA (cytosine-5)-methyltransferase 1